MLTVHVCSLWYSHSVKVNYCFIVLGICYHFVEKETTVCGCIALCWTVSVCHTNNYVWLYSTVLDYQCVIQTTVCGCIALCWTVSVSYKQLCVVV